MTIPRPSELRASERPPSSERLRNNDDHTFGVGRRLEGPGRSDSGKRARVLTQRDARAQGGDDDASAPPSEPEPNTTFPDPVSEPESDAATDTELDDAFQNTTDADIAVPTFSSTKTIKEHDDVVRVAPFPDPPAVERAEPQPVDFEAATPPQELWPTDLRDLFSGNPEGVDTWLEIEQAMHRLVSYHMVGLSVVSNLPCAPARDESHSRAAHASHAPRCSPTLQLLGSAVVGDGNSVP